MAERWRDLGRTDASDLPDRQRCAGTRFGHRAREAAAGPPGASGVRAPGRRRAGSSERRGARRERDRSPAVPRRRGRRLGRGSTCAPARRPRTRPRVPGARRPRRRERRGGYRDLRAAAVAARRKPRHVALPRHPGRVPRDPAERSTQAPASRSAVSSASTTRGMCSSPNTSGGRTFNTLSWGPVEPTRTPRARMPFFTAPASPVAGSFV